MADVTTALDPADVDTAYVTRELGGVTRKLEGLTYLVGMLSEQLAEAVRDLADIRESFESAHLSER